MSERTGICNKCGQRYGDIPESVTALKVKCQVCDGTVDIPPLPTAAPPATPVAAETPAPAPAAAPPEAATPAAEAQPLAAPLGEARPKSERPEKAKSIDRDIAAPAPPPATEAPAKPAKAIPPVKPVAKAAPIKPIKPVAKAAPIKPIRPVAKAAPVKPIKPVAKAAPIKPAKAVEPAAKAPAPVQPASTAPKAPAPAKPAAKAPAPAKAAPKQEAKASSAPKAEAKSSPADIIAKAKAKRATESKSDAPEQKTSAADIIAKAKAKRASEPKKKDSAGDIIARAKQKRAASESKPAAKKPAAAQRSSRDPHDKSIVGAGTRRPASSGSRKAATKRARRHREEEYEEKSKAPLIIVGVVVLAIIGGGSWYLLRPDDKPVETGETVEVPADPGAGETGGTANSGAPEAVDVAPAAPAAVDVAPASADPADTDTTGADDGGEAAPETATTPPAAVKPSAAWAASGAGEPISTRGVTDYRLIKLDEVPPLAKFSGSSDEEWVNIVEDLELFLDDSGAQSNRAGKRLVDDYPRGAYPAIVNAMMKVDFEDSDGMNTASALNDLLTRIGKGTNLGWDSVSGKEKGTEEWEKAVLWNKKVVASWQGLWVNKYAEDDTAWASFSSSAGAAKKTDKPAKEVGGVVGPEEDPFD